MKRFLAALVLSLFAGIANAGLTSLTVQFSPDATQFTKGEVIDVSAAGNGTNMQYRFVLEKTVGNVVVTSTDWSSTSTFQIDTQAVNITAAKYRLKVQARESGTGKKAETLVKTEVFDVLAPTVTACDLIEGKTYSQAGVAATINGGDLSLSQALSGLALTTNSHAYGMASASFDEGAFSLTIQPIAVRVCTFLCIDDTATPDGPLLGTYECSGNTVTISATGTATSSGALGDLLGGSAMAVSASGSFAIDTGSDSLSAGGRTFVP